MPILSQEVVDQEEEQIRQSINELSDSERKTYFRIVKSRIKDPDTYAVLNWFFLAGLHHFYLDYWVKGCVHLIIFAVGAVLIILGLSWLGVLIILSISIIELYALFKAQLIVQNYNNQVMKKAIVEVRKLNT